MADYPDILIIRNEQLSNENGPDFLNIRNTEVVRHFHHSVPAYKETALVSLDHLAEKLGVKGIYVKDESSRFGLNAFKGLGGIYALARVVCEKLGLDINTVSFTDLQQADIKEKISNMVFVTATDGNHGKGIAWAAGQLGCRAYVYMPKGSSPIRAEAIRKAGMAEVTITNMGYDDTVRYARNMSREKGWILVQDTSWTGYEKIPSWIIQGYTTMVYEAAKQLEALGECPTHVFLQAGVGAMAGGVTGFLMNYYEKNRPRIIIAEPREAACIFQSAREKDGCPHPAVGNGKTIMAGLNCGEPCTVTWPILRDFPCCYASCTDDITEEGMRILASPEEGDQGIVSGESGAVTMGLLYHLMKDKKLEKEKEYLGLDQNSVVLLFSTEGDTDPESYKRIVCKRRNEEG